MNAACYPFNDCKRQSNETDIKIIKTGFQVGIGRLNFFRRYCLMVIKICRHEKKDRAIEEYSQAGRFKNKTKQEYNTN